jgi:hypothetical protein
MPGGTIWRIAYKGPSERAAAPGEATGSEGTPRAAGR